MREWRKRWRSLGIGALVLMILAAALWPESIDVDVARVARGPLQVTIDDEGETRVRERFVISAPVAGRLQRIELEPGDRVKRASTILARLMPVAPTLLDSRTQAELNAAAQAARAAVGQARAERDRAAATLDRMRAQLRRQEGLVAAGAISREDFEATQTGVRTAEEALKAAGFAVTRAEFDVQMAIARLQPARPADGARLIDIVSPVDGVVLKRTHESEAVVPAGEPLLDVGDPTLLEVVADLLSTDAVRVKPQARVLIEAWGGPGALEGRVRRVEPSGFMKVSALGVEEQRVNIFIDFVDVRLAAQSLGDNYRVEVRIVTWESGDVLEIPTGALFRHGDGWAAFVFENGRARMTDVAVDHRNAGFAEVKGGVIVGQTVIVHPPDVLRDGARVRERPAS